MAKTFSKPHAEDTVLLYLQAGQRKYIFQTFAGSFSNHSYSMDSNVTLRQSTDAYGMTSKR